MKYRFEVIYSNEYMKVANKLINGLDLGIEKIGVQEVITFNCNRDDITIKILKDNIKKAFESFECEVLNIEGGKIE